MHLWDTKSGLFSKNLIIHLFHSSFAIIHEIARRADNLKLFPNEYLDHQTPI